MDEFLAAVGVQAMKYAIRSGIALTSTYALGQCSRLLMSVEDKSLGNDLKTLRGLLDHKIKIISPAIDLIEFKCGAPLPPSPYLVTPLLTRPASRSGRGNVFLESAAPLARSLHQEIVSLGRHIEAVVGTDAVDRATASSEKQHVCSQALLPIITDIKRLLERIDREIPLLQLAISASGETLSTSLPPAISPSRLLQASTLLTVGDTHFAQDPSRPAQIGPSFTLSLYMLFLGHAATLAPREQHENHGEPQTTRPSYGLGENARKPLWQEVIHKARVRLCRVRRDFTFDSVEGFGPGLLGPVSPGEHASESHTFSEYSYFLEVVEDLDDGRVHDIEHAQRSFDNIPNAGIRESIPLYQLSKIFYTDSGRILNIGGTGAGETNPVLLLKRDTCNAYEPSQTTEEAAGLSQDESGKKISIKDETDPWEDEQASIDKQLLDESSTSAQCNRDLQPVTHNPAWRFPTHLDPEWIALEVYEEDCDEGTDEEDLSGEDDRSRLETAAPVQSRAEVRKSLDSRMVDQIRRLSLQSPSDPDSIRPALQSRDTGGAEGFLARSPFGAITTSLSLMEMLIRLAGLQEFQQVSHLSIPDHILTFFLEETSTTGLVGESQWRVRNDAKRRVGFDPYTDIPTNG